MTPNVHEIRAVPVSAITILNPRVRNHERPQPSSRDSRNRTVISLGTQPGSMLHERQRGVEYRCPC